VDCTFDGCLSAGLQLSQFDATVPYTGNVVVAGCRFIAPPNDAANKFGGSIYAVEHNMATSQPEQLVSYFGNTAIGYDKGRRFVNGLVNGVFDLNSTGFMPQMQNFGWKLFDQLP